MRKTLLLAGVACALISSNANAGWKDAAKNANLYVGADYVYDSYDFKSSLDEAKSSHNSGNLNIGTRVENVGAEIFGQWSGKRTKDLAEGKLKTRVDVYGLDFYGYQPLGCEGKYDLLATAGVANYYYRGKSDSDKISKDRIGWRIGGGAMYNMTDHISARLVGRYAYIGAKDLNHAAEVTAGVRYSF